MTLRENPDGLASAAPGDSLIIFYPSLHLLGQASVGADRVRSIGSQWAVMENGDRYQTQTGKSEPAGKVAFTSEQWKRNAPR